MIRLIGAAACATLLSACMSTGAELPTAASAPGAAAMPATAMPYMTMAAASDLFEIQSSQIALQKTQNADVRQFAQMMVDHHTMTTQDLMTTARSAGLTPPTPMLPPDKAQKVAALQAAPAAGFDAMYMREQVMGHEEALALHRNYATRGDNAMLRQAAAKTAPIVEQHLGRARTIAPRG